MPLPPPLRFSHLPIFRPSSSLAGVTSRATPVGAGAGSDTGTIADSGACLKRTLLPSAAYGDESLRGAALLHGADGCHAVPTPDDIFLAAVSFGFHNPVRDAFDTRGAGSALPPYDTLRGVIDAGRLPVADAYGSRDEVFDALSQPVHTAADVARLPSAHDTPFGAPSSPSLYDWTYTDADSKLPSYPFDV